MKNSHLDDAYDIYFQAVSNNAENRFELALWSAWGYGAIVIDGGLTVIPGFDIVPDSLDKAKYLVNLFIQPMISIWYHSWEKQEPHSPEEMIEARKNAHETALAFSGMLPSNMLSIQNMLSAHLILDAELTYFLNELRKSSAYYIGMFHQRYLEYVTGEKIVEWDKLKVPIETWEDFLNHCDKNRYKDLDMNSSVATFALIGDAGARMFKEFERTYKRK